MLQRLSRVPARAALLVALAIAWLNFLLTVKWAEIPGSLNGWKRPWYGAALLLASILVVASRRVGRSASPVAQRAFITTGWLVLIVGFFAVLPPSTWHLIPFFDDWAPRFVATVDGIRLLARGVVVGWNWGLLGGYHSSADLSQGLSLIAAIPIAIFGPAVGYHLMHFGIMLAIPAIVAWDLTRDASKDFVRVAAFLVLIGVAGFYGTLWSSGDTNSIVGVFCVVLAISASRGFERGVRWGGAVLVLALTLALYTHLGFFCYACLLLVVESAYYRNRRMFIRAAGAIVTAVLAALPMYWELIRYPAFFVTNNLVYAPGPIHWAETIRLIYYNVEMLLFPHRWFNDYYSLTNVFWIVVAWSAWHAPKSRAGFYSLACLVVMAVSLLDVPAFGYLFARIGHLFTVFTPVALAWFIVNQSGGRMLATALVLVVGLYVQAAFWKIPHVSSIRDFDAALIDHLQGLPDALVLLEDNPHRDLIESKAQRSARTPFGVHFESLLVQETGRRYYAQTWDGWHWSPFRGQSVAGGSFRGRAIADTPIPDFAAEMRRWGIGHLVVWSDPTKEYLKGAPDVFIPTWSDGRWVDYVMPGADTREVVAAHGSGSLRDLDPLGGTVALSNVKAGDEVRVRMNYFPAWSAHVDGESVPLRTTDGQLTFTAPRDGDYDLRLEYPRRYALSAVSLVALLLGAAVLSRW